MQKQLIVNTIPLYSKAPISAELLKETPVEVIKHLSSYQETNITILVDQDDSRLLEVVNTELGKSEELCCSVLPVKTEYRFLLANPFACENLLKGEKPLPKGRESSITVLSVEDICRLNSKRLVVSESNGVKKTIDILKTSTVDEILQRVNFKNKFKALFLGFPMCMITDELQMEFDVITDYAIILTEDDCVLDQLKGIAEQFVNECCGCCTFGYEGLTQIHMILSDITQKKGKSGDIDLLIELCQNMQTQSLCNIGSVAAGLFLSAIEKFRQEIEDHIIKKVCRTAVCKKFISYHILQGNCIGCGECIEACEDDAILGKKKFVHVIEQDECTQCGKCFEICEQKAIVRAGSIKPKCPKKPVPCSKK